MKLYSVGTDVLEEYEIERLEGKIDWAVYAYEIGSYDGSGIMFYKNTEGTFGVHSMGHCSCYGPVDDIVFSGTDDWREVLEKEVKPVNPKDYDAHLAQAVYDKVLELMETQHG